jgi:hypothetical protein
MTIRANRAIMSDGEFLLSANQFRSLPISGFAPMLPVKQYLMVGLSVVVHRPDILIGNGRHA